MNNLLLHPRAEIMTTMERIYRYRMTTTSGGNLSILDEDGSIWITPARVDKGSLRRDDIVCVRPDGSVEGRHPPSSEFPFHKAIYAMRPDIGGIVHAHPVALVAFSVCKQVPNTRLCHHSRAVCGEVAFAPYAMPGSDGLGRNLAQAFEGDLNCVILENHGVVVGGSNLQDAFQRFETLEFAAKTIIKAAMIGEPRYLTDDQVRLPRAHFEPLPEGDCDPPGSTEKELRRELRDFVRRGYQQRLMISTEGSFSARLNKDAFLITPYQVDRCTIELGDIVLVREGRRERGKLASRASRNHRAIYGRYPEIGSIVNAYTVNASAFSTIGAAFSSHTIPESYIFLREVGSIPYGVQFRGGADLADYVSPTQPSAICENDGVLVTGGTVLEAFDRLEVLESTAEALINARALGEVSPMPDSVIAELKEAFLT